MAVQAWCRHCGDDIEIDDDMWVAYYSTGTYLNHDRVGNCPSSPDHLHHPANVGSSYSTGKG